MKRSAERRIEMSANQSDLESRFRFRVELPWTYDNGLPNSTGGSTRDEALALAIRHCDPFQHARVAYKASGAK